MAWSFSDQKLTGEISLNPLILQDLSDFFFLLGYRPLYGLPYPLLNALVGLLPCPLLYPFLNPFPCFLLLPFLLPLLSPLVYLPLIRSLIGSLFLSLCLSLYLSLTPIRDVILLPTEIDKFSNALFG